MLCTLYSEPLDLKDFIWEEKFDGVRCIAVIQNDKKTLYSRSGRDITESFPELVFPKGDYILDGEIIARGRDGEVNFSHIQKRVNRKNYVDNWALLYPAEYAVFDLIERNNKKLYMYPLYFRKRLLETTLKGKTASNIYPVTFNEDGKALFSQMAAKGGEGVVGKDISGYYTPGRRVWIKCRVPNSEVFYVVGYTKGEGRRESTFGSLLLARKTGSGFKYAGSAGTGFTDSDLAAITAVLEALPKTLPLNFDIDATWVEPIFKAKISYGDISSGGVLRFPVFKGMIE